MCNHYFCASIKVSISREKLTFKKIYLWLYTFYNYKIHFCVIKEKFRNYELIGGNIKDIDEECYEKALIRILREHSIDLDLQKIREIFYFLGVPIIRNHNGVPVFIGIYKNININLTKKKIKDSCNIFEDFEISNLHGEFRSSFKKRYLSHITKNILDRSIDEDWINSYKINNH